mgnify:FL=1
MPVERGDTPMYGHNTRIVLQVTNKQLMPLSSRYRRDIRNVSYVPNIQLSSRREQNIRIASRVLTV